MRASRRAVRADRRSARPTASAKLFDDCAAGPEDAAAPAGSCLRGFFMRIAPAIVVLHQKYHTRPRRASVTCRRCGNSPNLDQIAAVRLRVARRARPAEPGWRSCAWPRPATTAAGRSFPGGIRLLSSDGAGPDALGRSVLFRTRNFPWRPPAFRVPQQKFVRPQWRQTEVARGQAHRRSGLHSRSESRRHRRADTPVQTSSCRTRWGRQ